MESFALGDRYEARSFGTDIRVIGGQNVRIHSHIDISHTQ
jgi:hypothetical protein